MSTKTSIPVGSGTFYVTFVNNSTSQIWNGSSLQSRGSATWSSCAISLSAPSLGIVDVTTPNDLPSGPYTRTVYKQAGGSPNVSDDVVAVDSDGYWNGSRWIYQTGDSYPIVNGPLVMNYVAGNVSTGSFSGSTALVNSNNFYVGSLLAFTSGTLKGLARHISGYTGSSRTFVFNEPFPQAPQINDEFILIGYA